jgi:hypothetical protein
MGTNRIPTKIIAALTSILFVLPSGAFACDTSAVRINIDWLKTNNPGAAAKIANGCHTLNATVESGTGFQMIVDGYKDGQSHNPSAAAAIDGCTASQMLDICH